MIPLSQGRANLQADQSDQLRGTIQLLLVSCVRASMNRLMKSIADFFYKKVVKHKYYKTQEKPDRVNNFKIPYDQDCCSMSCPGIHARLVVVPGHLCDWCHLIGGSVNLFLEDVPQLV